LCRPGCEPVRLSYKVCVQPFPDRAGIEQNHVSRRFVRGHFEAFGGKPRGDALGIGDVHLTAESFQINFFHIKLLRSETAKKTAKK
jgi:hypothetical protein